MLQEKEAVTERQSAHQSGVTEVSSSLLHQQHPKMTVNLVTVDSGHHHEGGPPLVCHFPTHHLSCFQYVI